MTMPLNQIRILVVDDHPWVLTGCCAIIAQQPDMRVVGEFPDAESAMDALNGIIPDVILMDLRLPGMSGLSAIRWIHEQHPHIRVIVLTTYEGDEDIHQALLAGASSYVIKGMENDQILDTIRKVCSTTKYLPAQISRVVGSRPLDDLREREKEVLLLMAEGMSNRDIAEELSISERTVKYHVGMIFERFGVEDRIQALLVGIRRGYITL